MRLATRWSRVGAGARQVGRAPTLAKKEVTSGRAKSLSAFVAEAVDEELRRDELTAILDAMDVEHGKPTKAATAWAKRVLERSS